MRDMVFHHDQAVQMAELVKDRTNLPELVAVAGRINASQADEIAFMQNWLRERGESVPDAPMHRGMDMKGTMAGMASPADMARLATLKGTDFDRLFLTLMIAHHDGALKMVDELVKKPGSAYDPVLFQFTSEVKSGQKAEIDRMTALLGTLATDPRVGLKAGFRDVRITREVRQARARVVRDARESMRQFSADGADGQILMDLEAHIATGA